MTLRSQPSICAKTGRLVRPIVICKSIKDCPTTARVKCPSCKIEYEITNKWLEDDGDSD
jgi:hypothetical protein